MVMLMTWNGDGKNYNNNIGNENYLDVMAGI